jgi:hypothetical protein
MITLRRNDLCNTALLLHYKLLRIHYHIHYETSFVRCVPRDIAVFNVRYIRYATRPPPASLRNHETMTCVQYTYTNAVLPL